MLLGEPDDSLQAYMALAKREFAEDMVRFWIAVEKAKTLNADAKSFRAASVCIFIQYIKSRRLKMMTAVQRKRLKKIITTPGKRIPITLYDEIQALVFDVIYNRVFTRFLQEQRDSGVGSLASLDIL